MTKVAIIGCGPSGMFFLHAIALRRAKLDAEGDSAAIAALPEVTVFERSSSPGGIWRSDRNTNGKDKVKEDDGNSNNNISGEFEAKSTNMYEALWTNGVKECIEFFDYTFDEHFGCALPAYMPRALILEYILARCTRNNPTFFDDVKFNTSVKSVTFDEESKQFVVQTTDRDTPTEDVTQSLFDKCIWAGGNNGTPKMPKAIHEALVSGGFKGRVMHSSETASDFDQCVKGKKILIIGDSYSAEDLTLQAIKLGAETVDICSRSGEGIAYHTGSWPEDKVDIKYAYVPTGVSNDGRSIVMSNGTNKITMEDIATVIYCTGYHPNVDMLHPSLRPKDEGPYFSEYDIPKDWKMPKNPLSKEFGDLPLGEIISPAFVNEDIYRGQLISNPNMMFFNEKTDVPLIELDVTSWLLLAQMMGDLILPSLAEMKQFNLTSLLDALKDPICRNYSEENYKKSWSEIDDNHWSYWLTDKRVRQMGDNYLDLQYRILARDMMDAKYPLDIGTYQKLNQKGKALVSFNSICAYARYELEEGPSDAEWRTFRDVDPSKYYSIMTGTKTAPLKGHWLDIDGQEKDDIVDMVQAMHGKKKEKGWNLKGMLKGKLRIGKENRGTINRP